LQSFVNSFSGAETQICILITRAESYTEEKKYDLIDQLLNDAEFKEFTEKVTDKIFFSGAINPDDFEVGNNEALEGQLLNICEMRTTLYEEIFETVDACHITSLGLYKRTEEESRSLYKDIMEIEERLTESTEGTDIARLKELLAKKLDQLVQMEPFVQNRLGMSDIQSLISKTKASKEKENN